MIWKSRAPRAQRRAATARTGPCPRTSRSPPVVGSSCRMPLPTVVLPQPDSPTSASVRCEGISSDTPSTAFTWPTTRLNRPLRIGKCTFRSSTCSSGRGRSAASRQRSHWQIDLQVPLAALRCFALRAAICGVQMAAHLLPATELDHRRHPLPAERPGAVAAVGEAAAGEDRDRAAAPCRESPPAAGRAPRRPGSASNSLGE